MIYTELGSIPEGYLAIALLAGGGLSGWYAARQERFQHLNITGCSGLVMCVLGAIGTDLGEAASAAVFALLVTGLVWIILPKRADAHDDSGASV